MAQPAAQQAQDPQDPAAEAGMIYLCLLVRIGHWGHVMPALSMR
jgi:hypothetical protein